MWVIWGMPISKPWRRLSTMEGYFEIKLELYKRTCQVSALYGVRALVFRDATASLGVVVLGTASRTFMDMSRSLGRAASDVEVSTDFHAGLVVDDAPELVSRATGKTTAGESGAITSSYVMFMLR